MNKQHLKTINSKYQHSLREKGSKFLSFLFPCTNTDFFSEELSKIRAKYPDATHHCSAYRIDPEHILEFSADDGEPSGTAGLPILNQLRSLDVVNAGLVIVRYFGGTKLGKSGLIETYGLSARECLELADLQTIVPARIFELCYPYAEENRINKLKQAYKLREKSADYKADITLQVYCPEENAAAFEKELNSLEHLSVYHFKEDKLTFIPG